MDITLSNYGGMELFIPNRNDVEYALVNCSSRFCRDSPLRTIYLLLMAGF